MNNLFGCRITECIHLEGMLRRVAVVLGIDRLMGQARQT